MDNSDPPQRPKIACLPNGPYYLLNDPFPQTIPNLRRSNGKTCATFTGVALCRCGGSRNKPFCDGSHGAIGFSDQPLTDTGAGKRVSYAGKHITIHDNRAICAHAGRTFSEMPKHACTRALPSSRKTWRASARAAPTQP